MNLPTIPRIDIDHLDQVWFQVAGTRCNLECGHCFISCSPKNKSFDFLTLDVVKARLEEAVKLGVKEFYFTGGEPFINPQMTEILLETLKYGPATVLTNGTVMKTEWLERLHKAEQQSTYGLEFRVSIDGFSPETNDVIRGEGSFERAIAGVKMLVEYGFMPIITAVRTWSDEEDFDVIQAFTKTLNQAGYKRPRLKILPTLQIGAEENRTRGYSVLERITPEMMADFDETLLVCHNSRIVTDRGVHVCPILIEKQDSLMSDNLNDSLQSYPLAHGACFTCYQYGAICSNATGRNLERKSQDDNEPASPVERKLSK